MLMFVPIICFGVLSLPIKFRMSSVHVRKVIYATFTCFVFPFLIFFFFFVASVIIFSIIALAIVVVTN